MNGAACARITLSDLTDYVAGDLSAADAAALETHLFSCADCGARAAELDALVRAIRRAAGSAAISGIVTDAVLNRLARDGVRVRTFSLSPGDAVPCAVWDDDEVMALRLRGAFGGVREVTVSQRVGGREVSRATGEIGPASRDEIIYATPASRIRGLPVVEVDILLTARDEGGERPIARYTLLHGGELRRDRRL